MNQLIQNIEQYHFYSKTVTQLYIFNFRDTICKKTYNYQNISQKYIRYCIYFVHKNETNILKIFNSNRYTHKNTYTLKIYKY